MPTVKALQQAIAEAVATLDESDGSRVGMAEAIDDARDTLATAYGPTFEADVADVIASDDSDDDSDDDDTDADDDPS
jgi:hypothetical protein